MPNTVTVHTIYGGQDTFVMELRSMADLTPTGFIMFLDLDNTLHVYAQERIEYLTVTNFDPKAMHPDV